MEGGEGRGEQRAEEDVGLGVEVRECNEGFGVVGEEVAGYLEEGFLCLWLSLQSGELGVEWEGGLR